MKIGVFDSGVGGLSVANSIKKALPDSTVIYIDDKENLPYGNKTPETLVELVKPKLQFLLDKDCQVIVIACNTVSTTIIEELRTVMPVPLVAIEPMVKPASEKTKSGVIAVCATPTTLGSKRYQALKDEYTKDIKVIEPDCSDWTRMIESNQVDRKQIEDRIKYSLDQGADVVVLGCTHYHWIEDLINEITSDKAEVLQPEQAIIRQLKRVLEQLA